MKMPVKRHGSALLLLICTGCSDGHEEQGAGTAEELALGAVPALSIAADESNAETLVGRVVDAARLSNGGVIVVGPIELIFYDKDGRFSHRVGGSGEGPGEFTEIQKVQRVPGDS